MSWFLVLVTFPITIFFCIRTIAQYEKAVIFRLGRLRKGGAKGPGLVFILPCTDEYTKIDIRTVSFDVPPQEVSPKNIKTCLNLSLGNQTQVFQIRSKYIAKLDFSGKLRCKSQLIRSFPSCLVFFLVRNDRKLLDTYDSMRMSFG